MVNLTFFKKMAVFAAIVLSFPATSHAVDRDYADCKSRPTLHGALTDFFTQECAGLEKEERARHLETILGLIAQYASPTFAMKPVEGAVGSFTYMPNEDTDRFRNEITKFSQVFTGHTDPKCAAEHTEELSKAEEDFPGFRMVCNHLGCVGGSRELQTNKIPTPEDVFACIKQKHFSGSCWYTKLNCREYAYYQLILELYPNKYLAFLIINELNQGGIYPKRDEFLTLEKVKNPEDGNFIIYDGPEGYHAHHFAIYRGNGIAESKWGWARAIFQHGIFQVPSGYGERITIYKASGKALTPGFVQSEAKAFRYPLGMKFNQPFIAMERISRMSDEELDKAWKQP